MLGVAALFRSPRQAWLGLRGWVLGGLGRLVFLVYLVLLVFLVQPRQPSNVYSLISNF